MFDFGRAEQTEKRSEPLEKYKSKKNKVLPKLINALQIPTQHFLGCFSKKFMGNKNYLGITFR